MLSCGIFSPSTTPLVYGLIGSKFRIQLSGTRHSPLLIGLMSFFVCIAHATAIAVTSVEPFLTH